MFHNFDYEQTQKQKNTFVEVYNEKSTPSDISQQSIFENNSDIFQMIPALKELLNLAECENEDFIQDYEYANMLFKLKIRQSNEALNDFSKYFEFRNDNKIKVEEFVAFFTSDIQNIELQKYSQEELVLKIGLEIYRAVSKENISLELKHLVNYMKEHEKLDIDMTNMLEIFDFFMDPNQGILKSKTSLISFFHKNATKLARALSHDFLKQMQNIQKRKNDEIVGSRREVNVSEIENKPNIIKVYDSNAKNINNRPSLINLSSTQNHKETHRKERVSKIPHINLETQNVLEQEANFWNNLGISEVFQEILPKNRGWIMRKSNRHENKWSMVFLEILDNKLISTKPTILKKSINVQNLEIHKCNFLEVIKRLEPSSSELRKGHKRGDSLTKTMKQDTRANLITKTEKDKLDYLFFLVDKVTHKTYLFKSPDNTIIGSIIHFYILKENPNRPDAQGLRQMLNNDPEYSGVIEIAVCKKTSINKYHSSLKPYTFKKQFLVIKNGKLNIYEMKTKDNLDLLDYEAKIDQNHDFFLQSNQFIFSIEKNQNSYPHELIGRNHVQSNLMSIHENERPVTLGGSKAGFYLSPKANQDNFGIFNSNYEDLKVVEYKNSQSKGFFSNIFKKIQSAKKKDHKIIMACDTELKRRQWILTLKFFSHLAQSNLFRSSFSKDSGISCQEDSLNSKNSFQNDINPLTTEYNESKNRPKKKKQSSISFKQKAVHNPDFFDVYKSEEKKISVEDKGKLTPRDIEVRPNPLKKSLPLMTEPDASQRLDSEEILMTFTQFNPENYPFVMTKNNTLGNRIIANFEADKLLISNEIKSMSDLEIWQKFLLFFMQENHLCSEFDITNDSFIENTRLGSPRDLEALEEDVSIRTVIISDFNIKKS